MTALTVATKRCTKCRITKALTAFGPHPTTRDGRHSWCRSCFADYMRERRATDHVMATRDGVRAQAYKAAETRVREAHRDEFERYYAEELAERGMA